jgi:hypothetical protein
MFLRFKKQGLIRKLRKMRAKTLLPIKTGAGTPKPPKN